MGKHKHLKAIGFLHTSCEALIHTISQNMGKVNSYSRKKYGKTQTFQG